MHRFRIGDGSVANVWESVDQLYILSKNKSDRVRRFTRGYYHLSFIDTFRNIMVLLMEIYRGGSIEWIRHCERCITIK